MLNRLFPDYLVYPSTLVFLTTGLRPYTICLERRSFEGSVVKFLYLYGLIFVAALIETFVGFLDALDFVTILGVIRLKTSSMEFEALIRL